MSKISKKELETEINNAIMKIYEIASKTAVLVKENIEHEIGFSLSANKIKKGKIEGATANAVHGLDNIILNISNFIEKIFIIKDKNVIDKISDDIKKSLINNDILDNYKKEKINNAEKPFGEEEVKEMGIDINKIPLAKKEELDKIDKLVTSGKISPKEGIKRVKKYINGLSDRKALKRKEIVKILKNNCEKGFISEKEMIEVEKKLISFMGIDGYKNMLENFIKEGKNEGASLRKRRAGIISEERLFELENDN